jgi:hypothetical protein
MTGMEGLERQRAVRAAPGMYLPRRADSRVLMRLKVKPY